MSRIPRMSRPLFVGSILVPRGGALFGQRQESRPLARGLPRPEVAILGADQKERGLLGRECAHSYLQVTWWALGQWKGKKCIEWYLRNRKHVQCLYRVMETPAEVWENEKCCGNTTRIIHHNQLLFTKFGKNLRHIESMTSKVQPAESYWTDDVKMTSKVQPLQIIETLTEKTWGQGCVIFDEQKNKERNGETPLRRGKYFEWIIKQLLNSALGYEEFCRPRRVLSTSAFGLCG